MDFGIGKKCIFPAATIYVMGAAPGLSLSCPDWPQRDVASFQSVSETISVRSTLSMAGLPADGLRRDGDWTGPVPGVDGWTCPEPVWQPHAPSSDFSQSYGLFATASGSLPLQLSAQGYAGFDLRGREVGSVQQPNFWGLKDGAWSHEPKASSMFDMAQGDRTGQVIGQALDEDGNLLSFYPGLGWRKGDEDDVRPYFRSLLGTGVSSAVLSLSQEVYDRSLYEENPWIMENLDPDGVLEAALRKEREKMVEVGRLGFKAAGELARDVFVFEIDRGKAAGDRDFFDLLMDAFDIEETLAPVVKNAEKNVKEISEAQKEQVRARKEANYYGSEIGSDGRPTNLSFDMAEEGYRFEKQMPHDIFTDGDGVSHETEVFRLPAENTPVTPPDELPA